MNYIIGFELAIILVMVHEIGHMLYFRLRGIKYNLTFDNTLLHPMVNSVTPTSDKTTFLDIQISMLTGYFFSVVWIYTHFGYLHKPLLIVATLISLRDIYNYTRNGFIIAYYNIDILSRFKGYRKYKYIKNKQIRRIIYN